MVIWIDCEIDTALFTNNDTTFLRSIFFSFFKVRVFLCYLNSPVTHELSASIFQAPRVQEEYLNFVYVEVLISLLVNC